MINIRKAPCKCGSGRKYRKCCENKDELRGAIEATVRRHKANYKSGDCLHPACSGTIDNAIRSHTTSKGSALITIATDGHVYNFGVNPTRLFRKENPIELRKLGVNRASTFPGFCAHHDSNTFGLIDEKIDRMTPNLAFLKTYRATCDEVFLKTNAGREYESMRQIVELSGGDQSAVELFNIGSRKGLEEVLQYKSTLDLQLISSNFDNVFFVSLHFKGPTVFSAAGITQPCVDVEGRELQDLGDFSSALDNFSITISPNGPNETIATFAWVGESPACRKFIVSLQELGSDEIPNAVLYYALLNLENCYLSIDWYDSLSQTQRGALERAARNYGFEGQSSRVSAGNLRCIEWELDVIEANIEFRVTDER